MRKVGTILICGGIGSGKSELSRYLASEGVPVYDSDSRTKTLYDTKPGLVALLEERLEARLIDENGKFDRKALASRIFNDNAALRECEAIVHPAVLEDFREWRDKVSSGPWCGYAGPVPFVCMESAIALGLPLFREVFDYSVYVNASVPTRLSRVMARDNAASESVRSRMESQARIGGNADFWIDNEGTTDEFHSAADEVFRKIGRLLSDN